MVGIAWHAQLLAVDAPPVVPSSEGPDWVKRAELMLQVIGVVVSAAVCGFALFGDRLRARFDPIKLEIDTVEKPNSVMEAAYKSPQEYLQCYCHHLRVANNTAHKPVINCRVWLKEILVVDKVSRKWEQPFKFAVPRLMEWAPSEYSRDVRTFARDQVFDLGKTFANNKGFQLTINRNQGGAFQPDYGVNSTLALVFCVTADNYLSEREFFVKLDVRESSAFVPSEVTILQVKPVVGGSTPS